VQDIFTSHSFPVPASELALLPFLRELLRDTDDTPLMFCVVALPFVSSMPVFLSSSVSLNPPVCECDEPLRALLNHRVRTCQRGLFVGVRFGSSCKTEESGLRELRLVSVAKEYPQIERRVAFSPSHAGRPLSGTSLVP
jgi:hypothetical protein